MSSILLVLAVSASACGQLAAPAESDPSAVTAVDATMAQAPAAEGTAESYLPPPEEREPVERTLRGFHEYSEELQKWFKQEATAEKPAEQLEAIVALCALYHELRTDPRYGESDALQRMRIKIWSRLTRVKKELEIKLARREDRAPADDSRAGAGGAELLASLAEEPAGDAFGGGARRGDHGQELVELIERTIAPTKWDVNGGPFTIVYYAPLHALVVRASSDVHGRLGGLLGGLRRAGN